LVLLGSLLAWLVALAGKFAVETTAVMLLAGALHLDVSPAVPALSFAQAIVVNAALLVLSAYWTVPLAMAGRE
jgi:hypothetical protein